MISLITLALLCLVPIPLACCRAKVVEEAASLPFDAGGPVTPAASAVASATLNRVSSPTPPSTSTPLPEPTAAPTDAPPGEPDPLTHTVQAGDTLLGLAREYSVPMAAIQLQNGMGGSTVVQVGQVLSIPSFDMTGASPFWVVHVVEAGETLVGIARAYGLEAERIKSVNALVDASLIQVGQELVLPLDAPAVAQAPLPPPTPTPVPPPDTPSVSPTSTSAPPPTAAPAAPPPPDIAAWPHETARLINEVRAQHGLGPLAYNETLALAAQGQANDCTQRGWCSHTGSNGSDIKTRILRAGYEPASWAECWAQRKTPQGAVDIWMDEVPPNDPHRRTLLTTWLSEIGVGVAQTDWGYYFIADFGRPRD